MTESMTIAKTILSQISRNLMMCMGTKDRVALNETKTRRGGVMFAVNGKHLKRGKVVIELTHMDVYNVKFYKWKRKKTEFGTFTRDLELVKENEEVYNDMLTSVLEFVEDGNTITNG